MDRVRRIAKSVATLLLLVAVPTLQSCGQTQMLVFIDTNLPVPRFGDSLLIERLVRGDDGLLHPMESTVQIVANRDRWPASFGVALNAPALFRIRLYSGARTQNVGIAQQVPLIATTIDRIVEVAPSSLGVQRTQVFLDADCMGAVANLFTGKSCQSGILLDEEPTRTLPGSPATTRVGTWEAVNVPDCVGVPRAESDGLHNGEACIRGGVFALGDYRFSEAPCGPDCDGGPERMVKLSSYFIDTHEVTVKRWRAALNAGLREQLRLGPQVSSNAQPCLHLSNDPAHDNFPVNCVTWTEAMAFCAFDGGRFVTTEAQWEFAATSRGNDQLYVWGDTINSRDPNALLPDCDQGAFERDIGSRCAPMDVPNQPRAARVMDVGSSQIDRTAQGVYDMNGNLREWMRDDVQLFNTECWNPRLGVLKDPFCYRQGLNTHALRGPPWGAREFILTIAWRDGRRDSSIRGAMATGGGFQGSVIGFRCARPAQ